MSTFISGLDLCETYFNEIAGPLLAKNLPTLRYSAGLIGYGSDVIGFDDDMSTDHNWGPRFLLFLPEEGFEESKKHIAAAFSAGLPYEHRGFSTHYTSPDWTDNGVQRQERINQGPVNPLIETHTLRSYFKDYLGYTPFEEVPINQWLTFSEHRLLGITSGGLFHDDLGLAEVRRQLAYFPEDVWLWMMAAEWTMLAEEEAFVGRCGYVGDNIGSSVVAARQVQRLMRLGFLVEKRYAPYSKWFGSAFMKLECGPLLLPILEQVLAASSWQEREKSLGQAYHLMAEKHNSLEITEKLNTDIRDYFGRPFQVLFAGRFSEALLKAIQNPKLKQIVPPIGSVSQFSDSTTVFDDHRFFTKLKAMYESQ
jgi:hypothetical protein